MDLPLSGIIGAVFGVGVGLLDYALIAGVIRRFIAKQDEVVDPRRMDLVMKGLFVVNAVVFAILGWWVGVSVSGYGVAPG
ncbi:hypothetical protein [Chthonobacter albigriseus]|uniref:hypothetical protein n=1 Tax=Chthonobacter albigriseus TaxID=1683161 RepID=UPI0015EF31B6|nr:hypothetical protein [Chthonobacter albigriseus]